MTILTKILPLFLSVAPFILLAMDTDNMAGQKRPHSIISTTEKAKNEPNTSKRKKTEEQESLKSEDRSTIESDQKNNGQKISDVLDQTVPGQQNQVVYRTTRKYQQIDQIRQSIESLKGLEPQIRILLLGDHAENKLQDMETTYSQLLERYTRDFFGRAYAEDFDPTKDLSPEVIQHILSYFPVQDLKNLVQVSHAARHAVYGLPVFQKYFQSTSIYGHYQNVNEFKGDFLSGSPRAYAAVGIAALLREQDQDEKQFYDIQNKYRHLTLNFNRPVFSYCRASQKNKRNSFLDDGFTAFNPQAVAFVFHNRLFISSQGIHDKRILNIIRQTYRKLGTNRNFLLDTVILNYLQSEFTNASQKRKTLSIVKIFQTFMAHSIGANIILYKIYAEGLSLKIYKKYVEVIAPDKGESDKYFKTAIDIANMLPDDLKGQALTELGLWRLIELSNTTSPTDQDKKNILRETQVYWQQAILAWTNAIEGDRKKAAARFKSFLYDSSFFSSDESNKPILRLSIPMDIIFINTTRNKGTVALAYLAMPYVFLKKLYDSDKKDNDQPHFYHKDAKLMLRIATTIWDALVLKHGPQLSPDLEQSLTNELSITVYCFWGAIVESLRGRDAHLQQEIAKEIGKFCRSTEPLIIKIQKYERIAKNLGLIPTDSALGLSNTKTGN
ncbi:MAG: F-box protein [Candidatus Paracaedibacteraceae bacterium]|nr:F-box protein [Candidatus Paracaedibacteraceae bacterium]